MSFDLRFREPDVTFLFGYLTELMFQNNIDVPRNLEKWGPSKLRSRIMKLEKQYGPVL